MTGKLKTTSTYTFQNFKELYKAVARYKDHVRIKDAILEICLAAGAVLAMFVFSYDDMSYMFLVSLVLYPLSAKLVRNRSMRRQWNRAGAKWGVVSEFIFSDEYLEMIKEGQKVRFSYYEFKDILETKTHFFLMLGERNGLIIEKANCTKELIEHIGRLKGEFHGTKGNKKK